MGVFHRFRGKPTFTAGDCYHVYAKGHTRSTPDVDYLWMIDFSNTLHHVKMSDDLSTRPSLIPQPSRHPSITTGHGIRTLAAPAKFRPVYLPMRKNNTEVHFSTVRVNDAASLVVNATRLENSHVMMVEAEFIHEALRRL